MEQATQITDQIYIGPLAVARDLKELERLEISAVVCAAAEGRNFFPDDIDYWESPKLLAEHSCDISDILGVLDDVWKFCECRLRKGEKLYFHCVHGRTRSACFVTYILARLNRNTIIMDTYKMIQTKRDIFIPEEWLEAMQAMLSKE